MFFSSAVIFGHITTSRLPMRIYFSRRGLLSIKYAHLQKHAADSSIEEPSGSIICLLEMHCKIQTCGHFLQQIASEKWRQRNFAAALQWK
jgi:hypothetical protein